MLGTALLAGAVSLDGDGSTTFIVTTAAMLPIYLRLGMSPVVLTCVAGLTNGTLNIVPWGGPTVRAAAALGVSPTDIFVPMLPSLAVGLIVALTFAWFLGLSRAQAPRLAGVLAGGWAAGRRNAVRTYALAPDLRRPSGARHRGQARSGRHPLDDRSGDRAPGTVPAAAALAERVLEAEDHDTTMADTMLDPDRATLRPKLIWVNLALTLAVMVLLVLDIMPLPYVFMVGTAIALLINFPKLAARPTRSSPTRRASSASSRWCSPRAC